MRIILAGQLSQDRESMYWLNNKSIPSVTPRDNTLQVVVKTRIKLIYRPAALKQSSPEEQADKLRWQRTGDRLQVTNPTPYYMNFNEIKVGTVKIDDVTFVAPVQPVHTLFPQAEPLRQLHLSSLMTMAELA